MSLVASNARIMIAKHKIIKHVELKRPKSALRDLGHFAKRLCHDDFYYRALSDAIEKYKTSAIEISDVPWLVG